MHDPNIGLITRACAFGLAFFLVGASTVDTFTDTNAWVPVEGEPDVNGMQVAQGLTGDEIMLCVQWVINNADAETLTRITSQPGYGVDLGDVAALPVETWQGIFRDFEWSGRKRACLWCKLERQGPTAGAHYRVHAPDCPVDIIASGLLRSVPLDVGGDSIRFRLVAAPVSGYGWSAEHQAWVSLLGRPVGD